MDQRGVCVDVVCTSLSSGEVYTEHKFKPVLLGSDYYTYVVKEIRDKRVKKQIIVEVRSERGEIALIANADPNKITDTYFVEITTDRVTKNGVRAIVVALKNTDKEIVIQQSF
jgi:hypothetical protein